MLRKKGFYAIRQSGSHMIVENGEGLWTAIPRKDETWKRIIASNNFGVWYHEKRVSRSIVKHLGVKLEF